MEIPQTLKDKSGQLDRSKLEAMVEGELGVTGAIHTMKPMLPNEGATS